MLELDNSSNTTAMLPEYNDLQQAARLLRHGEVVAFPTETVYGLGANAYDACAAAKIFELKGRPHFDPLIVHVAATDQISSLAQEVPVLAYTLAEAFWPGPLTLVLPKHSSIPDIITSGLPTVGLRQPAHPVALELLRQARVPVAAPSANLFCRISPTRAEHVRKQFGSKVKMVLDGGACDVGVESTIISLVNDTPVLLRAGGLPIEAIEEITGPLQRPNANTKLPLAPGQLPRHYAPQTPLVLQHDADQIDASGKIGFLAFFAPDTAYDYSAVEIISPKGDLREAAANLFAAMHRLDACGLDLIIADTFPEHGLGLAINDRLKRASHKSKQTERFGE